MNNKYAHLLKILMEYDEWLTAEFLAHRMNVSKRSIKNYVAEINSLHPATIASSRKGYKVDKEAASKLIETMNEEFPQTSHERVNFIMKALLLENKAIDLYRLSEDIFVSVDTIKKDLVKVRKRIADYDLYLTSSDFYITLEGREKNKRKLLADIIYEEFNKNVLNVSIIQELFPKIDVNLLQKIITEECKKYQFFINGYAMMSLLVDIIISIERMRNNCTFDLTESERPILGERERDLSYSIASEIEKNFNVQYSETELSELAVNLMSHLMRFDYDKINYENVVEVVGEPCLALALELLDDINKKGYFIDSTNEDFIVKFALHVKNLLPRIKQGHEIKNPLTNHIKTTCPLIFECAVCVADHLRELTGYEISEDEIAYIALHVGAYLETPEMTSGKVTSVIVFPQYYNLLDKFIEHITQELADSILIKAVFDSASAIEGIDPGDLIITTVDLPSTLETEQVRVTPFCTDKDITSIKNKVEAIRHAKNKKRLHERILQISNPKLFRKNKRFANETEAIRFMVNIMQKEGYVDENYLNEVFERERRSSTAFGYIAVPHSLKMCAKKTGMFVLLNDAPFKWGEHLVKIVLLFAINKEDRALFYDVFDNLIVMLLESPFANRVIQCETYEEFIDAIVSCYDSTD